MIHDYVSTCLEVIGAIHVTAYMITELLGLWTIIRGEDKKVLDATPGKA